MANVFQSLVPGKSWRTGKNAPNNAVGVNGEFYLNDTTGVLYEKVNGAYVAIPLPSGGGGGVTSFNGRTGAVTSQAGDYSASDVGLGNVTNDAQLKRAAGDFATFSSKAAPAGADVLLIEDSADSGAKKRIAVSSLTAAPFDPSDLAPLARYRADNVTIVSGSVDTLVDMGSLGFDLVSIDATRRAPLGTDANGHDYLSFAPSTTQLYEAGVNTDWLFLNDDRQTYAITVVLDIPTASPWTDTSQMILTTAAWSSSSRGFVFGMGSGSVDYRFEAGVLNASSDGWFGRMAWHKRNNAPNATGLRVITINYLQRTETSTGGLGYGGSPTPYNATMEAWNGCSRVGAGTLTSTAFQASTGNPGRPLTLGGTRGSGINVDIPLRNARIYEIVVWPHALSPHAVEQVAAWAGAEYDFDPRVF